MEDRRCAGRGSETIKHYAEYTSESSGHDSFSLVIGNARKLHTFSPTMGLMRQVNKQELNSLPQLRASGSRLPGRMIRADDTGTEQCPLHEKLVSSHVPSQISRKTRGVKISVYTEGLSLYI